MSPDVAEKKFLKTKEAAHYCGVSKSFLEHWRIKGGGPRFIKIGKTVLYEIVDLNTWLEASKQSSTTRPSDGRPSSSVTEKSSPMISPNSVRAALATVHPYRPHR